MIKNIIKLFLLISDVYHLLEVFCTNLLQMKDDYVWLDKNRNVWQCSANGL